MFIYGTCNYYKVYTVYNYYIPYTLCIKIVYKYIKI